MLISCHAFVLGCSVSWFRVSISESLEDMVALCRLVGSSVILLGVATVGCKMYFLGLGAGT